MQITHLDDTIAAISTAQGEAGISIVRLSGKEAVSVADKIFVAKNKNRRLLAARSHTIICGHIVNNGNVIDEVLVMLMRSPRTYTKEDMVEINCHGGYVAAKKILESCLKYGARLAQTGEFTKRAFLNGRIDLSQAEAVLDVIKSKTDLSLKHSLNQLNGALSAKIKRFQAEILDILAGVEVAIDFPEDDVELSSPKLCERIKALHNDISLLSDTSRYGIVLRQGARAVICGRPNVGKSSLFNTLLKQDRAIVTHIPGTTRDTIEETVNIKGLAITLIDTAGIADTDDIVESEGMARTRSALEQAELCLFVLDSSSAITEQDRAIFESVKDKKTIVVLNKIDLVNADYCGLDSQTFPDKTDIVKVSCLTQEGMPQLEDCVYRTISNGSALAGDNVVISNIRQREILERAKRALSCAIEALAQNISPEFVSLDIREALDALGEVAGETITEDILERIFSQFCIGK